MVLSLVLSLIFVNLKVLWSWGFILPVPLKGGLLTQLSLNGNSFETFPPLEIVTNPNLTLTLAPTLTLTLTIILTGDAQP